MAEKKIVYEVELQVDDSGVKDFNKQATTTSDNLKDIKTNIDDTSKAADTGKKNTGGFFNGIGSGIKSAYRTFIANPLGLLILGIVGALKGLYDAFQRSSKGQEILAKGMGVLNGVLQVLSNAFDALSETIISAFENPEQAWEDFKTSLSNGYNFIKTQVTDRISGLFDKFAGNFSLLTGNISKMWNELWGDEEGIKEAEARIKAANDRIQEGQDKIDAANQQAMDGVNEMIDGIVESYDKAVEVISNTTDLELLALQLKRDQIDAIETIAGLERDIAVARQESEDKTATINDRLADSAETEELINQSYATKLGLKQRELDILVAQNALGGNNLEDTEKEKELTAEIIALEKEKADALTTVSNARAGILDEAVELELKSFETIQNAQMDALNQELINKEISYSEYIRRKEQMDNDAIQNEINNLNRILTESEITEKKRIEIEQRIAKATIDLNKKKIDEASKSFAHQEELLDNEAAMKKQVAEAELKDDEKIAKAKAAIDLEYHQKKLDLYIKQAQADGMLTDEELANISELSAARDESLKQNEDRGQLIIDNAFAIAGEVMNIWSQVNDVLNAASERRIDQLNTQYDADIMGAKAASDEKTALLLKEAETEYEQNIIKAEQQAKLNNDLLKLEADKNKKIEDEKKKQFNRNKAFQLTSAVVDGAAAFVKALASAPPPVGPILAAASAASSALQIATIASQKYALGGILQGPLHAAGGINLNMAEAEGGEFIVNRASTQKYAPVLDAINSTGNAQGDISDVKELIDYDRLAEVLQSKKVYVVSSEITNQQATDVKIQDSVQF